MMVSNKMNQMEKNKILMFTAIAVILSVAIYFYLSSNQCISNQTSTNPCNAGILCENLVYCHTTGNLTFTISHSMDYNWTNAVMLFVPASIPTPRYSTLPANLWSSSNAVSIGNFPTNTNRSVTLPISGSVPIGTDALGELWAKYQINSNSTVYYAYLGSVTLTAS